MKQKSNDKFKLLFTIILTLSLFLIFTGCDQIDTSEKKSQTGNLSFSLHSEGNDIVPEECESLTITFNSVEETTCESCVNSNGTVVYEKCEDNLINCDITEQEGVVCIVCETLDNEPIYSNCDLSNNLDDDEIDSIDLSGLGTPCGNTMCPEEMVCCNESCGICTFPDEACIEMFCDEEDYTHPNDDNFSNPDDDIIFLDEDMQCDVDEDCPIDHFCLYDTSFGPIGFCIPVDPNELPEEDYDYPHNDDDISLNEDMQCEADTDCPVDHFCLNDSSFGPAGFCVPEDPSYLPVEEDDSANELPNIDIEEVHFCGGIAGIECPEGFECYSEGNYADAGGICLPE